MHGVGIAAPLLSMYTKTAILSINIEIARPLPFDPQIIKGVMTKFEIAQPPSIQIFQWITKKVE